MFHIYADGKNISQPFVKELTILSPRLVLEFGKAGSFEFSIPPCHAYYESLKKLKSIITVKMDDVELFRGRVLSHERTFNNVKKVYAEGCLAYLVDTVQKNEKYKGTTHDLFRKIVAQHNAQTDPEKQFEVGIIGIEDREIVIAGTSEEYEDLETGNYDYKQIAINSTSKERTTSFDYIENNIIEYCGGYLRTRSENGVTYLDLLGREGVEAPQPIRFGTNMLDLTEEATAEDVFSVLIPIGDENLTIAEVNGGSEELVDEEALELFGRIVKAHVFDGVSDAGTLKENGLRFIKNHENVPITFTIKAIDMHMIDPNVKEIHLGESVLVKSRPHNLDLRLICIRIEYDLEKPENTTYTFGNQKQTLTQRYQKDKSESSINNSNSSGSGGASSAVDKVTTDRLETTKVEFAEKLDANKVEFDEKLDATKVEFDEKLDTTKVEFDEKLDTNKAEIDERLETHKTQVTETLEAHQEWVNEKTGELNQQWAEVKTKVDDVSSTVEAHAAWSKEIEGKTEAWHSELVLKATENGEAIALLRSQYEDHMAALELYVNQELAKAVLKAEYEEDKKSQLELISNATESVATLRAEHDGKIAALEAKATEQGTQIEAKADKILLEGYVKADALSTEILEVVGNSVLTYVHAESLFVENVLDTYSLSATEASLGSITVDGKMCAAHTLTIGEKTCTFFAPADATFDFADTEEYAAAVSAGKSSVTLSGGAGWVNGRCTVTASNGQTCDVLLPFFSFSGGTTFNSEHKTTVNFTTASVNTPLQSVTVDASSEYEAGRDSVSIQKITCTNTAPNTFYVTVSLDTGYTTSKTFTIMVSQ